MKTVVVVIVACLLAGPCCTAQSKSSEPEEPDFGFIAGGPYTQAKNAIQIIHATTYGTRRFDAGGRRRDVDDFLFFFRTEWGFTDRLELDVITPVSASRERLDGQEVASASGYADTILGIRYRLLTEGRAPVTLTTGPQFILPTGSVARQTEKGSAGIAWDVSSAKDWGGPLFLFSSFNYAAFPAAGDSVPDSAREFDLHRINWAAALAARVLERPRNQSKHDLHALFEGGGLWEQEVESGVAGGFRKGKISWTVSPGLRYAYLTARETLIEIGVAMPIGLGPNGPKKGVIIQVQFERLFERK